MPIFELMMLICFGVSWPISLHKTYTSHSTAGKSIVFSVFIVIGYIFGIVNKLLTNPDYVIYFYILNALMVSADVVLWCRNRRYEKRQAALCGQTDEAA